MTAFTKIDQLGGYRGRRQRKAMNAESDGQREKRERWQAERDEHMARHPQCEHSALGGLVCWGRRTVHHIKPRGSGGTSGRTGPLVTLCVRHHEWVEMNRLEAKAMGLLVRREPWR